MKSLLTIHIILIAYFSNAQPADSFVDSRNGKTYKTTLIGKKTWMAENLDVVMFQNGDSIPEARTREEWRQAFKEKKPAWCYFDNDSVKSRQYGKLYNWYAIIDPRTLAPAGWYIPEIQDWTLLITILNGVREAARTMKSTSGWYGEGDGFNQSGFTAIPGGYRKEGNGRFEKLGQQAGWWSSSPVDYYSATYFMLTSAGVYTSKASKGNGYAVRCIKN